MVFRNESYLKIYIQCLKFKLRTVRRFKNSSNNFLFKAFGEVSSS